MIPGILLKDHDNLTTEEELKPPFELLSMALEIGLKIMKPHNSALTILLLTNSFIYICVFKIVQNPCI